MHTSGSFPRPDRRRLSFQTILGGSYVSNKSVDDIERGEADGCKHIAEFSEVAMPPAFQGLEISVGDIGPGARTVRTLIIQPSTKPVDLRAQVSDLFGLTDRRQVIVGD